MPVLRLYRHEKLLAPSLSGDDCLPVTSMEAHVEAYRWMPFMASPDGEYFFWAHESLKSPKDVMEALVNGYHPPTMETY